MSQSPMLDLLSENCWNDFQYLIDKLRRSKYFDLVMQALCNLNHDALFVSEIHGLGHIERTILHGGFCCMEENTDYETASLIMDACSYHDVGRCNDKYDYEHGYLSSLKIGALTGRKGDELKILQAAVTAHSRNDSDMSEILSSYEINDNIKGRCVSELLKDSDGLDRVRVNDLDANYLRRNSSRERNDFAVFLFSRYQQYIGLPPIPQYPKKIFDLLSLGGYDRLDNDILWDKSAFRSFIRETYKKVVSAGITPDIPEFLMNYFGLTA